MLARFLAALALLAAFAGSALAQSPPRGGPGQLVSGKVEVGGVPRTYLAYIPAGYRGAAMGMVVAFHGSGGTSADMALASGLSLQAEPANYVAVYPQGLGETWNTGGDNRAFLERSTADDIAFTAAVMAEVRRAVAVDDKRIYAAGFSKGAMFAYYVTCKMPGVFAAVAAVSGPMLTQPCTPSADASVLHIHGTVDQNVPFAGGRGAFTDPRNSWPRSIDGLKSWAARDYCDAAPTPAPAPAEAPAWFCSAFANCRGSTAVTWCLIAGGGHEWPAAAGAVIAAFLKSRAL